MERANRSSALPLSARKALYTPREVAAIARVDPKTVMNWIHRGRIAGMRLSPRIYRVPLGAVIKLVAPDEIRRPVVSRTGRIPRPGYKDSPAFRARLRADARALSRVAR